MISLLPHFIFPLSCNYPLPTSTVAISMQFLSNPVSSLSQIRRSVLYPLRFRSFFPCCPHLCVSRFSSVFSPSSRSTADNPLVKTHRCTTLGNPPPPPPVHKLLFRAKGEQCKKSGNLSKQGR